MFAAKNKDSPQDLLKAVLERGGRLLLTIPFGSSEENCVGFVAVIGSRNTLPVLMTCVQNVTLEQCTVSTIVFPSSEEFNKFCERLYVDSINEFQTKEVGFE